MDFWHFQTPQWHNSCYWNEDVLKNLETKGTGENIWTFGQFADEEL